MWSNYRYFILVFLLQLVQMWDMIEELENNSNAHAKMNHVNKLNHEIIQQRSQLGNITDALPIIKNRVNGIDEKIQKISSTLPNGKVCCCT